MKTLFLDDNPARQHWALRCLGPGNDLTRVWDAQGCIEALQEGPWDQVFLDHDLGGEIYQDASEPNTGSGVVRWVAENAPEVGLFVVHSLNGPAAREMLIALEEAGYRVARVPFLQLMTGVRPAVPGGG